MGYNVLIPRLPRHGLADRKVENLSPLKAEELRDCADASVDIACGLAQKVYVARLSAGGTLSAWIAQNRTAQKNQQIEIVYPVPGCLLSAPWSE
jgi:esterase/lipase